MRGGRTGISSRENPSDSAVDRFTMVVGKFESKGKHRGGLDISEQWGQFLFWILDASFRGLGTRTRIARGSVDCFLSWISALKIAKNVYRNSEAFKKESLHQAQYKI